ncbi:M56 family metallopeptidase [Rufibacter sp. LB8]|uniref:M56 family metallopeptidase n=1 Tax=Rufibacter sp. LB8 TaxID=2777781 RepID=UPI00178C23AB|nr:M56 family metallopeptidase [Rufibacter sp. LB8]
MNETLLRYLVESSAALAVFYLFYALVLRRETCFGFNRFYLLGALVLALALPFISLPAVFAPEPEAAVAFELVEISQAEVGLATEPLEEPFNVWPFVYAAYGLGVLFFLVRFGRQVWNLHRFKRQESAAYRLQNQATVYFTHGQMPTFSFLNTVFLDNSQTLSPQETDRILQHEQVHLNQKHSLDILWVTLVGIVFWFNPLLYFYRKALEQTHEFLADAHVVKSASLQEYSSLLLKQVFQKIDFQVGSYFFFSKSLTLARIKMMKNLHKSPRVSRMLLVVPVLALLVGTIAAFRPVEKIAAAPAAVANTKPTNGPAEFPGGQKALDTYVKTQFALPEVAFQKRKSTAEAVRAVGAFEVIIQENGTAKLSKVTKLEVSPNQPAVQEAVKQEIARLVREMPTWTPAQKGGKAMVSTHTISFSAVSADFANRQAYLQGRQQKTSVDSKPAQTDEKVYVAVEQMPDFPGGQMALFKYLTANYKIPASRIKSGKEATLVASFIVRPNGKITDVQVLKSLGAAEDKELVRVLTSMPTWGPGKQNGKAVAVKYTIPFRIMPKPSTAQPAATTGKGAISVAGKPSTAATASGSKKMDGALSVASPEKVVQGRKLDVAEPQDDRVFIAVEKMPEFPGGQKAMFTYLTQNFHLPAGNETVEGTVVLAFVVSKEGNITKTEILKGLTPAINQEVLRVINSMPTWEPGTQNGKPVAVKYTVPFRIVPKN